MQRKWQLGKEIGQLQKKKSIGTESYIYTLKATECTHKFINNTFSVVCLFVHSGLLYKHGGVTHVNRHHLIHIHFQREQKHNKLYDTVIKHYMCIYIMHLIGKLNYSPHSLVLSIKC